MTRDKFTWHCIEAKLHIITNRNHNRSKIKINSEGKAKYIVGVCLMIYVCEVCSLVTIACRFLELWMEGQALVTQISCEYIE